MNKCKEQVSAFTLKNHIYPLNFENYLHLHFLFFQFLYDQTLNEIIYIVISGCDANNADKSCCGDGYKCGENEGDCDNDWDCQSGLECGVDNCSSEFPESWYDCCYDPNNTTDVEIDIFGDTTAATTASAEETTLTP